MGHKPGDAGKFTKQGVNINVQHLRYGMEGA